MGVDLLVRAFPQLKDLDINSTANKWTVIGSTIAFSIAIFFVSYLLSFNFETYRSNLRKKEKVFWCLAFVRAVFGFVGMFFGVWFVLIDYTLHDDVVSGINVTSFLALHIFIGFFIFECTMLYVSNIVFRFFDPFLAAHHTLSLTGGSFLAYYGKGHFFGMVGLLLEMTTPFTCLCWMLLKANMSHYRIWKVNQMILVHLFHCRTSVEAYVFYKIYLQWDNVITNLPPVITFFLCTQLVIQFFLLTPYWTYKKMMQLFNPVDWNHPELHEKPRVNGFTAISHEHKD